MTPRAQNPYIAGNPVGGGPAFVGRTDVLRAVYRILRDPQHHGVVLYGQRRIGKTSILLHLVASLAEQGPYRPVYFDLQDKAKWPLGEVLVDLARAIADAANLAPPVPDGDPATWFRATWLPSVLADLPEHASLVILFDEFDVLADVRAEYAASAFFPYLRRLLAETRGRVRFVFVIGRNIDDLANIAQSLFKSLPAMRVSLLAREDAEALIRMSEVNGSLAWDQGSIEAAWALTNGHPFLLQHLCWHVWERLHDEADATPHVTIADVTASVPHTLETARNVLGWLWDGLPPAERVVASALAGAGARAISQNALEQLLHESGVRVVMRELRDAPQLLQEWDLIEPSEGGYRFRVELLRQWIARFKPLSRVQKELDYVEPIAENLYRAAELHYKAGDLEAAAAQLRAALRSNPNHARASELLADILISRRDWPDARRLLEQLYENHPTVARARLVQVLMALVEAVEEEDERLGLLDRVLELQRKHPEADAKRRQIWRQRGDRERSAGRLAEAVEAYRAAGFSDLEKQAKDELRRRELDDSMKRVEVLEQQGDYVVAYDTLRRLAEQYTDLREWSADLARLERAAHLKVAYRRAVEATSAGDREGAVRSLLEVITREPGYQDATARLHELVTGVNVETLTAKAEREVGALWDALATEQTERAKAAGQLAQVRGKMTTWRRWAIATISVCAALSSVELAWTYHTVNVERDRRKRFAEEGALQFHKISISAKKRRNTNAGSKDAGNKEECSESVDEPFHQEEICRIEFDAYLRNNLAGIRAPNGLLCIKHIKLEKSVAVENNDHAVPPQSGSPCTYEISLNMNTSVDVDQDIVRYSLAPLNREGSTGTIYKGEHRVELWWQEKKLGETTFEVKAKP